MEKELSKENFTLQLAAKVRKLRRSRKLTQKQLGNLLGLEHNTISSYESGTNDIDAYLLFKMANIFEVPIEELFKE